MITTFISMFIFAFISAISPIPINIIAAGWENYLAILSWLSF